MKNSDLPLIQALKNKSNQTKGPAVPSFDQPRAFEVKHAEIPGLAGHRVGEHISVNLKGRIHSQHANGHAVVHVSSVKPDSSQMKAKQNPDTTDSATDEN